MRRFGNEKELEEVNGIILGNSPRWILRQGGCADIDSERSEEVVPGDLGDGGSGTEMVRSAMGMAGGCCRGREGKRDLACLLQETPHHDELQQRHPSICPAVFNIRQIPSPQY